MTDTALAEPAVAAVPVASDAEPSADVADVAETFVELMRSFTRARARMLAAAEHDVEWSAHLLLKIVRNEGPLRAGALAEYLQADPSTVSRQVAALVKDGLLERRADQHDGRASLLVVTERGDEVLIDHHRIRMAYFADMLADWNEGDVRTFARLLRRFTADYEASNNDHCIRERIARSAARTTANTGSTTR